MNGKIHVIFQRNTVFRLNKIWIVKYFMTTVCFLRKYPYRFKAPVFLKISSEIFCALSFTTFMQQDVYSAKNMPKISLQVYLNSAKLLVNFIDRIVILVVP